MCLAVNRWSCALCDGGVFAVMAVDISLLKNELSRGMWVIIALHTEFDEGEGGVDYM